MKKCIYILLLILSLSGITVEMASQPKRKSVQVSAKIVDTQGIPVGKVLVTSKEGAVQTYSAPNGNFKIWTFDNSVILLEKNGYETRTVQVSKGKVGNRIVMEKKPLFSGESDVVNLTYGISATERSVTGAVSSVSGRDLMTYPDLVVENSLSGRLSGLTVIQQAGEFGRNQPQLYVRGYSTFGNNQAIVLVDGLERPMNGLLPEEIESVTVLKDATSKILYGPRAANGVILVKTKRGERYKRSIEASVEYGVTLPVALPEYLGAAEYAGLYNEACLNDGISPFYSQKDLDGYASSSGMNDLRYPDLDYYDYFLRKSGAYRKITTTFMGGNEGTRYWVNLSYLGGDGIEKVGKTTVADRFSVRGNLDIRISDAVSAYLDVAGRLELDNMANQTASEFFGAMSSHRPNEYPLFLEGEAVRSSIAGDEVLGGSFIHPDNLYSSRVYGGYRSDRYFTGQADLGFDIDLKDWVKGLQARLYLTMDNYSYISKGQTLQSVTYAPVWSLDGSGTEKVEFVDLYERKYQGDVDIMKKSNEYNLGYYADLSYKRDFSGHLLDLDLLFSYYRNETPGSAQDIKNLNTVLRAAYSYKDRYYLEATGALMGSGRFAGSNRFKVFPALGAAWVMSEENWFNAPAVDFMKIRVSSGLLGYDATTPFYLYEQRWSNKGDIGFGNPNDETNIGTTGSASEGNPDLRWEKSFQTNAGVDLTMFDTRFDLSFDWFYEYRYDIIQQVWSNWQTTAGHMVPYQNWGVVSSQGFELDVNWHEQRGDFSYAAGLGVDFSASKILRDDNIPYADGDSGRSTVGAPVDYILGYRSSGLFPAGFDRSTYPMQTLGHYQAGDIRYLDMNGDNIIDDLDKRYIGNTLPRTVLSLDLNLNYKGFGLYVLGTAHLGYDKLLNNSYYWGARETGKYSAIARDRWHPTANPDGTYPRLTVTEGTNNFTASDFWLEDAAFFRLKNVELSYTFTSKNLNSVVGSVKAYVRGTNLWTVSAIRDLDPEVLNGGVTSYPLMSTITGGVSITF